MMTIDAKCLINHTQNGNEVTNMKVYLKKMIAPIVVSVLIILYFIVYFGYLIMLLEGVWKYILGIVPLVFVVVMVMVCIERIQEIRKGEEDDIGKY